MNAHEYLKGNKDVIRTLFNLGLIPPSVLNGFKIYQYFTDCLPITGKKSAINRTAHEFKITTRTVYNAIRLFEQKLVN